MQKSKQSFFLALFLLVNLAQQSASLAQTKVVVVPLGGEAAKPTIYTEVQLSCGILDNLGSEFRFTGMSESLQKVREKSTIEVQWTGGVSFSNVPDGTSYVQTEIRVNDSVSANAQTTSVVTQEDIDNQTSTNAVFTDLPAGQYFVGLYAKTNDSTPGNIVTVGTPCFIDTTLIVKEIGG